MQTVKGIFDKIQSTSSKKEKEDLLRANAHNELLKETLLFLLNPYITTGISEKKMNKKVATIRTPVGLSSSQMMSHLTNNNTGTDEVIARLQNFVCEQPPEMQEFYRQLFTKSLKLGCAANTVNKVFGKGFIPQFDCMLAEKFFEHQSKVDGNEFTVTLKLDGIRAIIVKDEISVSIFSRQGQPIEGLVDIENEVRGHSLAQFVLDGELLISNTEGIPSKDQYKATTKIVRKDGEKHGITFRAFDFLQLNEFKTQSCLTPYAMRRGYLESLFSKGNFIQPLPVLYRGCDTSQIIACLDKVRADGQEGCMVNLNDAPYEFKRTCNLLKVKVMQDCDLRIIGFEEGSGRLTGTLGRLNVDYKGNVLGVGSGFTDEQRVYFWNNQEELIGRVVKINYFEETQDKDGKLSCRFPVFVELRDEGKEVSYA